MNTVPSREESDTIDRLRDEIAQLRTAEQQFRGLVEYAPDAVVVVDQAGCIVLANRQTEVLFGYERNELLGQTVEILLPERLRGRHQGHRSGFMDAPGVRLMGSGLDLTARRKDGSEVPVEISLSPVPTAAGLLVSASIRGVAERRAAQQALRDARDVFERRVNERTADLKKVNESLLASEAKLRLITDNMPAGMAFLNADQIYLYHNQTFADWLGLPTQEIDGRSVREVLGEALYAEIREKVEVVLSGKPVRYEREQKTINGDIRRLTVRYSPHFGPHGVLDGCMAMLTDITEQRQAEQALQQAQKMEAVGQLTGGVAHDFNNLLTVVMGNLQILASEMSGQPLATELIEAATKAARRGAELNRTLLAFSRRQRLAPMPVDFNALIAEMAGMLRRTLGEQIQIVVAPSAGLQPAMADPAQLEAALLNLAVNARDAMPQGGKLTIEAASAYLDEHYAAREADVTPGAYVMLAVSDTGSGMTAEVQQRAFEPFFTTKDTGKGSGLGLAMVYGFVKQSGGHLKIYSELGHGTTIKLYLPISNGPHEAAAPVLTKPQQPTGRETVLVVEDEEDVRALVCRLLSGLGYRVLQAGDGRSALTLLQQEPVIDLLFTDVVLPGGMNGPELARAANGQGRDIKVLYTSGYTGNAIQQLDALATEVRLISKPYRIEELARKVRNALDGAPD